MMKTGWLFMAFALVACSGGKDGEGTGEDSGGNTTPGTGCDFSIAETFPVTGDSDVYFQADVRFILSDADEGASITVTDGAGTVVTGTSSVDGTLVSWSGDEFAPTTQYTATLSWSCDDAPITFTTSDVGGPITTDLTGFTYDMDIGSANIYYPPQVGGILQQFIPADLNIFFEVTEQEGATVGFKGAIGTAGIQDVCFPTLILPELADFDDPTFELAADVFPLALSPDLVLELADFSLTGGFAADGSSIEGAKLVGTSDTRPLGGALGLDPTDEGAVCDFVASFAACEPCPGSGEPYCLTIKADGIAADSVNVVLEDITAQMVDDNPDCIVPTGTTSK